MKRLLVLLTMILFIGVLAACEPANDDPDFKCMDDQVFDGTECVDPESDSEWLQLTIEELEMYDGNNGNPAYVAVNGVIYDVTDDSEWSNGSHEGYVAGTDLTSVIGSAPHGSDVLDDLEEIGEIVVDDELLSLTLEELAMYDGEDGNPAYIAVDGVIYDVTDVSAWTSGEHNGGVAGTDISDLISSAPHSEGVLDNLDVVGQIVE